jgi:hypothetical protein
VPGYRQRISGVHKRDFLPVHTVLTLLSIGESIEEQKDCRQRQKEQMNMVHVITYDLRKPGRDYSDLYDAIKSYESWAHPLESVWFVDTQTAPGEVRDYLKQHIDSNDKLFVCRLVHHWASFNLSDKVIEWLKADSRTW